MSHSATAALVILACVAGLSLAWTLLAFDRTAIPLRERIVENASAATAPREALPPTKPRVRDPGTVEMLTTVKLSSLGAFKKIAARSFPPDVLMPSDWTLSRANMCARRLLRRAPQEATRSVPTSISIVYGAAVVGQRLDEQLQLVYAQIDSLFLAGLLSQPAIDLHVALSHGGAPVVNLQENWNITEVLRNLAQRLLLYTDNATIHFVGKHLHQYPALRLLWTLARADPTRLYLYLHNEGLAQPRRPGTRRTEQEMVLFREVVAPWRALLHIFGQSNSSVQHVGLAPAELGWQWFNFWWARGSYLACNMAPLLTSSRRYYQYWLSFRSADAVACEAQYGVKLTEPDPRSAKCSVSYSLFSCKHRDCVNSSTAMEHVQQTFVSMEKWFAPPG